MAIEALLQEAARQLEGTVEQEDGDWYVTCPLSADDDDPAPDEDDYTRVLVTFDATEQTITAASSATEYAEDTDLEAVLGTLDDTVLARVYIGDPDDESVSWVEVEATIPLGGATADWLAAAIQEVADVSADIASLAEDDAA